MERLAKEAPFCIPKDRRALDPSVWLEAVKTALQLNPANGANLDALRAVGVSTAEPQKIAVMVSNYWGVKGVDLPVYFMDGGTTAMKNKILQYANKWGDTVKGGNVRFRLTNSGGEPGVRITRTRGEGYYSYLGPDILHIPQNRNTMNLEAFTETTPDSEYDRVVTHEFGHTLGCPHDQLRKAILDLLDANKVIAYFMRTQGWSRQEVINQILTPVSESELMTLDQGDVLSIMTYQFPGSVTKSGQPIPGGTHITDNDYVLIRKVYPVANVPLPSPPVSPPPPAPGGAAGQISIDVGKNSVVLPKGWTVSYGQ